MLKKMGCPTVNCITFFNNWMRFGAWFHGTSQQGAFNYCKKWYQLPVWQKLRPSEVTAAQGWLQLQACGKPWGMWIFRGFKAFWVHMPNSNIIRDALGMLKKGMGIKQWFKAFWFYMPKCECAVVCSKKEMPPRPPLPHGDGMRAHFLALCILYVGQHCGAWHKPALSIQLF